MDYWSNKVQFGADAVISEPLPPAVRDAFERRQVAIGNSMGATNPQVVAASVAELMLAFTTARRVGEAEAKALVTKYTQTLSDLPAWAVRAACQKIAMGKAEGVSLDFPPAAPRLREVVSRELFALYDEDVRLRRVLSARPAVVVPPDARERINAGFVDLKAALAAAPDPIPVRHERNPRIAEIAAQSKAKLEAARQRQEPPDQSVGEAAE